MRAFITGSHIYGKPTEKSDIDLVVLIDKQALDLLRTLANEEELHISTKYGISASETTTFQFGRLNLMCCEDKEAFQVWANGTDALEKRAREKRKNNRKEKEKWRVGKLGHSDTHVTREEATQLFQLLRQKAKVDISRKQ